MPSDALDLLGSEAVAGFQVDARVVGDTLTVQCRACGAVVMAPVDAGATLTHRAGCPVGAAFTVEVMCRPRSSEKA